MRGFAATFFMRRVSISKYRQLDRQTLHVLVFKRALRKKKSEKAEQTNPPTRSSAHLITIRPSSKTFVKGWKIAKCDCMKAIYIKFIQFWSLQLDTCFFWQFTKNVFVVKPVTSHFKFKFSVVWKFKSVTWFNIRLISLNEISNTENNVRCSVTRIVLSETNKILVTKRDFTGSKCWSTTKEQND